jgi:hypothetical protein
VLREDDSIIEGLYAAGEAQVLAAAECMATERWREHFSAGVFSQE